MERERKGGTRRRPAWHYVAAVAGGLVAAVVVAAVAGGGGPRSAEVPLSRFEALVSQGAVASAVVDPAGGVVTAALAEGHQVDTPPPSGDAGRRDDARRDGEVAWGPNDAELMSLGAVRTAYVPTDAEALLARLRDAGVSVEVGASASVPWASLLSLVMLGLFAGLMLAVARRSGPGALAASSRGPRGPAQVPDTRFTDVVGCDEAVAELAEVSRLLEHRGSYEAMGARVPRGFLLVGPPGTGKTLLARACAGEAGVPFFAMSASDFVEMFVGMGASRVRKLFDAARRHERAIVFIDELDSVGKSRSSSPLRTGASDEQESTLNALLVEMDGFQRSDIVVLAATNRPDVLDPALLRSGRFDRQVHVPLPDRRGRAQLFAHYLDARPLDGAVDCEVWARRTVGMSGADIEAVCNDAALVAVRRGRDRIDDDCLDEAVSTAYLGRERRSALVSDADREVTAHHEAGHAVVALAEEHATDPVSVSIVPRGPAGGVTWLGERDEVLSTREHLHAQLAVMMGGRAGELAQRGTLTQGASDDIARGTELATSMVARWGMGRLGPVSVTAGLDGAMPEFVQREVAEVMDRAQQRACELLEAHRDLFDAVAAALLERETLDGAELAALAAAHGLGPAAGDESAGS